MSSDINRLLVLATRGARLGSLVLGLVLPALVNANPSIEGYDLVSSVRVDRTIFDYSYRVRLQGDAYTYANATVTVAPKSVVTGTVVTKPLVTIGQLDAGSFVRTSDVFTIRQDRTYAFDPSQLILRFAGTPDLGSSAAGAARVGAVAFVEDGGRPGHEGTFKIQGGDPPAGAARGLTADVYGSPNAVTYQMLSATGSVLVQGSMLLVDTSRYIAEVSVPTVPFQLQVSATGADGKVSRWASSRLFTPAPFDLRISPASAALDKGESVQLTLVVKSASASGAYVLSLLLPAGFTAGASSWVVNLSPGQSAQVITTLVAPLNSENLKFSTLVATIAPSTTPQKTWQSQLKVMVQ